MNRTYSWSLIKSKTAINTYYFLLCFISELVKPKVLISSNTTIDKGQHALLRCNVTGNPTPNITWFRNDKEIEMSAMVKNCKQRKNGFYGMKPRESGSRGTHSQTSLFVCSASHSKNTGSYKCLAKNSEGMASAETYLNVLGE